jgi:hypothetical protein
MSLFIRLTLLVAAALAALFVLVFVLKLLVAAAVLAGLFLAALFLYNFASALLRRSRPPAVHR